MSSTYQAIARQIEVRSLRLLGAFHPRPEDAVPPGPDGPCQTLILIGNVGDAMWRAFAACRPVGDNPLDQWSRSEIGALARTLGGHLLLPSDGPPWRPFQRWARRGGAYHPSPIGILIHPDYGLWHAFRGALAFSRKIRLPARDRRPSPCESCPDKPCLGGCPVDAFATGVYDVPACTGWLAGDKDGATGPNCLARGCAARRACPVGRDHVYRAEQAGHHMAAFLNAHK